MKRFFVGSLLLVAALSLAGNGLLYMRYSSARPLFQVNNEVIRLKDLDDRIDYQYSKTVLREMIVNDVVMQAAAKEGVAPTAQDVTREQHELQRDHPELIAAATRQDPSLNLFKEHLTTALALRNLRLKGVAVSDSDVRGYYAVHHAEFTLPKQVATTFVEAGDSLGAQTAERLLQSGVSNEVIASQEGLRVEGVNAPARTGMPSSVSSTILGMKAGGVHAFRMGSGYLVARVNNVSPGGVPPLAAIKPRVELAAQLAKAPSDSDELIRLIGSAKIKVESDKYGDAVPQVGTPVADAVQAQSSSSAG